MLEASADAVWAAVKTPAAFRRVTRGILAMPVIGGRQDDWREGETVVGWVFLFGFLPFSRHHGHCRQLPQLSVSLRSREGRKRARKTTSTSVTHVIGLDAILVTTESSSTLAGNAITTCWPLGDSAETTMRCSPDAASSGTVG